MKILKDYTKPESFAYYGFTFKIPSWANYVATDESGSVCLYSGLPHTSGNIWRLPFGEYTKLWDVDLEGENWKDTLREIV